jgi:hypothetical protein
MRGWRRCSSWSDLRASALPCCQAPCGRAGARCQGVRRASAPANLRWPGGRPARLNSLRVCTLRAQTLRSSSIRESVHVRVARYAPRRSRSHAGRPPGQRRRPALMRAPARPHGAWRPSERWCITPGLARALRKCEREGGNGLGVSSCRDHAELLVSRQAVRGAGPHKGVAPERLLRTTQRGYESALARIEPRDRLILAASA